MIRKANLGDLDRLLELLYQLSPLEEGDDVVKGNLERTFRKIIDDENYCVCVLEKGGKILGTGTLLVQMNLSHEGKPYAHIENVVVDVNSRGIGAGKKIVNYLIEKGKKVGCYKIILNCSKDNISFYEKCGFADSGEVEMRLSS